MAEHLFLVGLKPELARFSANASRCDTSRKVRRYFSRAAKPYHFYLIESGQVVLDIRVLEALSPSYSCWPLLPVGGRLPDFFSSSGAITNNPFFQREETGANWPED